MIFIHRNSNQIETPGALTIPDKQFGCLTLELPYDDNKNS